MNGLNASRASTDGMRLASAAQRRACPLRVNCRLSITWSDCTGFKTRSRLGGKTSSGRVAALACGIGVTNEVRTAMRAHCSAVSPVAHHEVPAPADLE